MIKDNQKYFNRLHLLVDAIVVVISYLLAWYIKFCTIFADTEPGAGALDMRTYFSFLYFVIPEYIVLYYFFNNLFVKYQILLKICFKQISKFIIHAFNENFWRTHYAH